MPETYFRVLMPHLPSRPPNLSLNTLTWYPIRTGLWAASSHSPEDLSAVNLGLKGFGSLSLHWISNSYGEWVGGALGT